MKIVSLILLIIFAFFIVTFSLENASPVYIKYYSFFNMVLPIYMLLFISLLIGVIITGFLGIVERFRLNRTISRLNRTIRDLRKELRTNEAPPIIEQQKTPPED
ncbi:MAG TPA: LapA family protein [Smithellaceae bacterium]|nr:LapA family protein [Smithellaceae bacterium]